jgi:hypothetical protein
MLVASIFLVTTRDKTSYHELFPSVEMEDLFGCLFLQECLEQNQRLSFLDTDLYNIFQEREPSWNCSQQILLR